MCFPFSLFAFWRPAGRPFFLHFICFRKQIICHHTLLIHSIMLEAGKLFNVLPRKMVHMIWYNNNIILFYILLFLSLSHHLSRYSIYLFHLFSCNGEHTFTLTLSIRYCDNVLQIRLENHYCTGYLKKRWKYVQGSRPI